MDAERLNFSKKQYVCTTQNEKWDKKNPTLGFAIPYLIRQKDGEPNAQCKKRMTTVDNWANGWDWHNKKNKKGVCKILDNKPTEGFRILQVVSRYSTENKVFEILDPRGFKLQIYCGNLLHLIENCTIINGVIQEPLMWSDTMQLVTEEDYKIAFEKKEADAKIEYVKQSTIPLGSTVKLSNGKEVIWLGKHHCIICPQNEPNLVKWSSSKLIFFEKECSKYNYDRDKRGRGYYTKYQAIDTASTMKIVEIVDKPIVEVGDGVDYINNMFKNGGRADEGYGTFPSRVLVSKNKFDIKIEAEHGESCRIVQIERDKFFFRAGKAYKNIGRASSYIYNNKSSEFKIQEVNLLNYWIDFIGSGRPYETQHESNMVTECFLKIGDMRIK